MDEHHEPSSPAAIAGGKAHMNVTHSFKGLWLPVLTLGAMTVAAVSFLHNSNREPEQQHCHAHAAPPPAEPAMPQYAAPRPMEREFAFCNSSGWNGSMHGYSGCCSRAGFTQGNWPYPGQLFKGSLPAVYIMANDGKRYIFPTVRELTSWYGRDRGDGLPDENDASVCSNVMELPDRAIAQIMIGGNITRRPGSLIKIRSDPKIYVVTDVPGTLRLVKTEQTALRLFGPDWVAHVQDIHDVFFVNYRMGTDIQDSETAVAIPRLTPDALVQRQ